MHLGASTVCFKILKTMKKREKGEQSPELCGLGVKASQETQFGKVLCNTGLVILPHRLAPVKWDNFDVTHPPL